MGFQLHETMYGKNLFEHQLPALINALERTADTNEALLAEKQNQKNMKVKTKFCTFNKLQKDVTGKAILPSLQDFINEVGYENVLNILPCGVQHGECFYTVIYKGE